MLGLAATLEGLNDDHAATATGAWTRAVLIGCCLGRVGLLRRNWHGEQLASAGDIGDAAAVGEQSIVADAMEAVRQNVGEEAADGLGCGEGHEPVAGAARRGTVPF